MRHAPTRISCRLVMAVVVLLAGACSAPRLIPVQVARISQAEFFKQTFEVPALRYCRRSAEASDALPPDIRFQYCNIDKTFTELLGRKNWQTIKDEYGLTVLKDELYEGGIYSNGLLTFFIYLDPEQQDHIYIEATGRYFIFRESNQKILLAGDFHVPLSRYPIASLESGGLDLSTKLYISRIPGKPTYNHESSLHYRIAVKKLDRDKGVYSIDYQGAHPVELMIFDGMETRKHRIGQVRFGKNGGRGEAVKVFDLRGLQFIRDDYGE